MGQLLWTRTLWRQQRGRKSGTDFRRGTRRLARAFRPARRSSALQGAGFSLRRPAELNIAAAAWEGRPLGRPGEALARLARSGAGKACLSCPVTPGGTPAHVEDRDSVGPERPHNGRSVNYTLPPARCELRILLDCVDRWPSGHLAAIQDNPRRHGRCFPEVQLAGLMESLAGDGEPMPPDQELQELLVWITTEVRSAVGTAADMRCFWGARRPFAALAANA